MPLVQVTGFCQDELICRGELMGWTERHKTKEREVKLPLHYTKNGLGREDPKVKSKSVSTTHPPSGRRCYWETEDTGGRELDESDGEDWKR